MRSVVQVYPGPPRIHGAVAQLGERLVCNQEATGSIPVSSTKHPEIRGLGLGIRKSSLILGVSFLLASNIGLEALQRSCKGLNVVTSLSE